LYFVETPSSGRLHSQGLLESFGEDGLRYWTFPPDYPERITPVVERAAQEMMEKDAGL